ncbi:MAG TPA: alpha/beta hydrolase [Fibrobacteria bacterium]|nr:alpha/beta hydrolase [Fibrobacteria bacterium]
MRFARAVGICLAVASAALCAPPGMPLGRAPVREVPHELKARLASSHLDIADSIHWVGTAEVDGIRVAIHSWIPSHATATVFLLHGYYDHSGVWEPHVRRLLARNVAVVAMDLPGHGLSEGRPMDVDSFGVYARALRAVEDSLRSVAPRPWSLAGHSLGGAVALERARRPDYPYAKTLLLAPMVRYAGWAWTGAAIPVVSLFKDDLARNRKLVSSSDSSFLARLSTDPMEGWTTSLHWLKQVRKWHGSMDEATFAPTDWMILQGGLDGTVDWKYGLPWLRSRLPGAKALMAPLARHHLHNEGGRTGIAVRQAFDDFLSSPPSQRPKIGLPLGG